MKKELILLTMAFLTISSCQKTEKAISLKEDEKQILALHNLQRIYHFNKDSIAFANQLSDRFISVNRGIISTPSKKETISRYNSYFSSVNFTKWDDVSKPIIKFSDDGSMAYTIVDKIVEVNYANEANDTVKGTTHFAWTTIYKKYKNGWKIDCVTSTNRPIEP